MIGRSPLKLATNSQRRSEILDFELVRSSLLGYGGRCTLVESLILVRSVTAMELVDQLRCGRPGFVFRGSVDKRQFFVYNLGRLC